MKIGPGDRFGRYEIRSCLGAGAMGEVFRAYDPRLDREVALKVLSAALHSRAGAHARFEQEARSASALNHSNIVSIYDVGEEGGRPFIVMELLDGHNLRALLSEPVSTDLLLRLGVQIADALQAAHARGIVHRDLKPENIFVTSQGVVKVLDFGLARISDPAPASPTVERLTQDVFVGTPGYAAPEALSGSDVDQRADLFSFGAILYEMVCGTPAFSGRSTAEALAATLRDEPRSAVILRPGLSPRLGRVIARCLEKSPDRRYSSAREIGDALRGEMASGDPTPTRRRRKALPVPLTPLIGREDELQCLVSLFVHDAVRLVTLTGPGGGGKTRLALAAAEALMPHFRDEVFFVPLAAAREPALVSTGIAAALGASIGPGESGLSAAITELNAAGRPTLLVLDNFEQVIGAAGDLSELLAASPSVFLMVTSREVLHLYGEHHLPVPPLPLPEPEAEHSLDAMAQTPAVALFIARAQAVDPRFRLTRQTADVVAEICRRLDGLPLALELAAARIRTLPPDALLVRLGQRLQTLTSGARDLPDRQHTMRRAIDWSYGLLTPSEQTLFRRLSVFVGPFTLEGAEAVCDPYQKLPDVTVDVVASLVDKSLLQRHDIENASARFGMLETIREYASSLLTESPDNAPTRRAHAAYFLVLAEEGAQALAAAESAEWLAVFAREHDNFRAALAWLLEANNAEWGLRLSLALFHFWERAEHLGEGRRWLTAFLDLPPAETRAHLRARALFAVGVFAAVQSDHTEAIRRHNASLELYRELHDPWGMAVAHNALGIALIELGDFHQAARHFEESLVAWRQAGDESGYARSLSNLASVRKKHAQYDEARRLYDEAVEIFTQQGDQLSAAWILSHQAGVARDQKQWDVAKENYHRALEAFRYLGDTWGIASTVADLGTLARDQGDRGRAAAGYREALCAFVRLGHRRGVARVLESMAVLAAETNACEQALVLASAAATLRQKLGVPGPITDQVEMARWLDIARRAVDHATAKEAQHRGALMTVADVVRYADSAFNQA